MHRIIVVEDEHLVRKGIIYGFDYESLDCIIVGEAGDGETGIELIKELKPDIVITDINMPIKNAFQMLEETSDYFYSTIIISGYSEFAYAQQAIKLGVSEFIVKPINVKELEEALKKAIYQCELNKKILHEQYKVYELTNDALLADTKSLSKDDIVSGMIAFIEKNYNKKFVFQDVSQAMGYSSTWLNKQFKDYTNYTFNDYLNRFRIQKALNLIYEGQSHIYEIATQCGYSDYKYFNKVFKKYIGMSATNFVEKI